MVKHHYNTKLDIPSDADSARFFVPAGYTARLEDGVLILEPEESEDERVRRWLIDQIKAIYDFESPLVNKAIAYLEKKKINTEGDFGRGYDCGYQAGYAVAMNEMKPKVATATLDSEKQKEQKPRWEINNPHTTKWTREMIDEKFEELVEPKPEWSEDERIRKELIVYFQLELKKLEKAKYYQGVDSVKEKIAYLERQKYSPMPEDTVIFQKGVAEGRRLEREEQKSEWSEEDKKIVETICKEGDLKPSEQRWLKSLKNRGNFPKSNTNSQSWSEEDEKMLVGIIERGSAQIPPFEPALRGEQMEWLMNRLKSLRPSWKPSEEQMKVFFKATPVNLMPEELLIYQSLYDDIKKLM